MVRYGINNFSRNAWLTIAATAVMTITLLIILSTIVARQVLTDTVDDIQRKVDMSIYLESDTTPAQAGAVVSELKKLSTVRSVNAITPKEAREEYAETNKDNPRILQALNESIAPFPWSIRVNVENINDTAELQHFVETNATLKKYIDTTKKPSFSGPQRRAIENIGRIVSFAEKLGLVLSVVFVTISSLIVFNTIRMAIFNRKEEIQMMKLIGADKSFIRGPFVVEAVVYGFIAAVIATGIAAVLFYSIKDKLVAYGVSVENVSNNGMIYAPFILLGMILAGALIGIISSLLATRKYLKV
jgi:cell division transport system permease protein